MNDKQIQDYVAGEIPREHAVDPTVVHADVPELPFGACVTIGELLDQHSRRPAVVTREHFFTGEERELELSITTAEYEQGRRRMAEGALVQDAFPTLSADEREFLITGLKPGEWEEMFPDEAEEALADEEHIGGAYDSL